MVNNGSQYDVSLEVACPKCGGHKYRKVLIPNGPRTETVFACKTILPKQPGELLPDLCSGMICYCRTCKKYYSKSEFLRSGNDYVCRNCYTVQLEYSEYKRASDHIGTVVNSIRNKFGI